MPDDKSKTKEDRKLASAEETYEVAPFARKYGIPESEAATIITPGGASEALLRETRSVPRPPRHTRSRKDTAC